MISRAWLWPAAALIAGCASVGPIDQGRASAAWDSRRAKLQAIDHFSVEARAVATGALSGSASLNWHQAPHEFDLRVTGPLGVSALTMAGDENEVRVRTKKEKFTTNDPEGTLRKALGWTLPLRGLRYWVLSLPSPNSEYNVNLDQDGLVETLTQDGWVLEYTDYMDVDKIELPRRILLTQGGLKLRVLIDRWSDLPQ
jgi:outer membrane lipoprotein LolB